MNINVSRIVAKESVIILIIAMITFLLVPLLEPVNIVVDRNSIAEVFFIVLCLLTT